MAPLTWKLLLATLASGQHCSQSESCEDQTALLQSHLASHKSNLATNAETLNFPKVAHLIDPAKRKMALAQFEDTAMELAKNRAGVTDVVVQVCNETSELLRDTVMTAIVSEHDTDVSLLATAFSKFAFVESERLGYLGLINAAIDAVYGEGGKIEQHVACRTLESQQCVNCGECRQDCTTTRTDCDDLEAELRLKYIDVINTVTTPAYCDENLHIHPPHETTTVTIAEHHQNKAAMEAYIQALAAFEACEITESEHCTSCPDNPLSCTLGLADCPCLNHTHTRTDCNTIQQALQAAQCESRHTVSNYLQLYTSSFNSALQQYQDVEAHIRTLEADRKVEWTVLEHVICLLMTLSVDEDGAASSVETANAIQECEDMIPDTSHLDIDYPVPPEMGDLPDIPHSPCSAEFENDAYDEVPPHCAGNEHLKESFDHGLVTECECSAEPPTPEEVGFPYELGPFELFDTGLDLNSAQFSVTGETWSATVEGVMYSGITSPFAPVTFPPDLLNAAFGLETPDEAVSIAWCYPDPKGTTDMLALHGAVYPERTDHRFIRTGAYVYLNAAGSVVALKAITPESLELTTSQDPELVLMFGEPNGITAAQAQAACTHFQDITFGALRDAGALKYCWHKTGTVELPGALSFCTHGCFLYETEGLEGLGHLAFPVLAPTDHLATPHRGATDQQGAADPSMNTGQGPHDFKYPLSSA